MPLHETICKRVSGEGTSYTVLAMMADPEKHPPLKDVGYKSPTVIMTVFTDGGEAVTSHDRYKVVRELDGNDDWLLSELDLLEDEVHELSDDV